MTNNLLTDQTETNSIPQNMYDEYTLEIGKKLEELELLKEEAMGRIFDL